MRAGQLRERITIQKPTGSTDSAGQVTYTWATHAASVPAKVEFVGGGEMVRGRAVNAKTQLLLTVRHRTDVPTTYRVSWSSRTWCIVAVGDPYGTRRETRIECREVV